MEEIDDTLEHQILYSNNFENIIFNNECKLSAKKLNQKQYGKIIFSNCTFINEFIIDEENIRLNLIKPKLHFSKCIFKKGIIISGVSISIFLNEITSIFHMKMEKCRFDNLEIKNSEHNESISFSKSTIVNALIENVEFNNELNFSNTQFENHSKAYFKNVIFNSVLFSDAIISDKVEFNNIKVKELFDLSEIKRCKDIIFLNNTNKNNNGIIKLNNLKAGMHTIKFKDTYVGNISILDSDFEVFTFENVIWCKKIIFFKLKDEEYIKQSKNFNEKIILRNKLEYKYRQLKKKYKVEENHLLLNHFHANELRMNYLQYRWPRRIFTWSFWYRWTSFFGFSCLLPLLWILIIILFFSIITHCKLITLNSDNISEQFLFSDVDPVKYNFGFIIKYYFLNSFFIKFPFVINIINLYGFIIAIISKIVAVITTILLVFSGLAIRRKYKA